MDKALKRRLRVTGEMAEKFFPQGFCEEVLDLVEELPAEYGVLLLDTYDFFLQAQRRYQDVAHSVYQELRNELLEEGGTSPVWRLEFLERNAETPYAEEYVQPLRSAYREITMKPSHLYSTEDVVDLFEAIKVLAFVMQDSPAYPSERALKFYSVVDSAGAFSSLSVGRVLKFLLPRVASLLEEHRVLAGPVAHAAWR